MQPSCLSLCCAVVIGVTHYALRVTFFGILWFIYGTVQVRNDIFQPIATIKDHTASRVWWHTQEDCFEFEASQGYVSTKLSWATFDSQNIERRRRNKTYPAL